VSQQSGSVVTNNIDKVEVNGCVHLDDSFVFELSEADICVHSPGKARPGTWEPEFGSNCDNAEADERSLCGSLGEVQLCKGSSAGGEVSGNAVADVFSRALAGRVAIWFSLVHFGGK